MSSQVLKVCVVDDEPIVCERLELILGAVGLHVETFTSGRSALARLSETVFDILVTDIKMEQPDGIALLRHVKTHSPTTRVVVITGFATAELASEVMEGGAAEFLAKPFRLAQLKDRVMKIAQEIRATPGPDRP